MLPTRLVRPEHISTTFQYCRRGIFIAAAGSYAVLDGVCRNAAFLRFQQMVRLQDSQLFMQAAERLGFSLTRQSVAPAWPTRNSVLFLASNLCRMGHRALLWMPPGRVIRFVFLTRSFARPLTFEESHWMVAGRAPPPARAVGHQGRCSRRPTIEKRRFQVRQLVRIAHYMNRSHRLARSASQSWSSPSG